MSGFFNTSAQPQEIITEAVLALGRQNFVGRQILPIVGKDVKSGQYPVIGAANFNNRTAKEVANGSKYPRSSGDFSMETYTCEKRGHERTMTDDDINEADDAGIEDLVTIQANLAMDSLLIEHDIEVAAALSGAGFNSTAATAAFSSTTNAKPRKDIKSAIRRLVKKGFNQNLFLIIEDSLYTEMELTDDLQALINGSGTLGLSQAQVAGIMGLSGIIICPSVYNSAAKGQSYTATDIWSTSQVYVAQIAGGSFLNGGIGRTMKYNKVSDGDAMVETYREEDNENNVVRVKHSVKEVIINSLAGEVITSC